MSHSTFSRRQFNKWLAAGLLSNGIGAEAKSSELKGRLQEISRPVQLHVAAVQMVPRLGDVQSNMNQAEDLVRKAMRKGAQWVILPEGFTSASAFHPVMFEVIEPFDGAALRMLRKLAREGNAVIGGSFLARREQHVYNTFVLAFPDGSVMHHDKDLPTYWENCFYRGGNDDGVLPTPIGPVGSVLCWEFIRSGTARRLLNKVNMVVGGSCWWTLPDDADPDNPLHATNLRMWQQAPPRLARMLGVPVVHGAHVGKFEGYFSPELPDVPYNSSYLGQAMIVDENGKVLASMEQDGGEGIVAASVRLPKAPAPSEQIPEKFWIPEEMPDEWKESWERWLESGADYYEKITRHYLETGIIAEYVPEYLR